MTSALADAVAGALREVELELAAEEQRQVELTAAERWARDPVGWINAYVWIASMFGGPRGRGGPMRITLYPDQVRTIAAWIDLDHLEQTGEVVFRNVVIEKSRQIGETWLFAALLTWALHYHVVHGLCVHQKGAEIANRGPTPKSLFGRIKYIDARLDRRTVPGLGTLSFKPFAGGDPAAVENVRSSAIVYGEPRRDDPGRGGTFDFVLVDEAAHVEHGEAVYAAISRACPVGKALLSTPKGFDNFHARIADEEPEGWTYLRLHWSTHPVYSQGLHVAALPPAPGEACGRHAHQAAELLDVARACQRCQGTIAGLRWTSRLPNAHRFPGKLASPWYDGAVIGETAEAVASELDIDRERSLTARVYDEWSSDDHVRGVIAYDPLLRVELGFDYGLDFSSVVICQDADGEYRVIGEVELVDKPGETPIPENVAAAVVQELLELGVEPRFTTHEWTRRMLAYGDPSGDTRELTTGRTKTAEFRRCGFEIKRPPASMMRTVEPSIRAVKRLLLGTPKPVVVSARCQRFIRHIRHNRWKTDSQGQRRLGSVTASLIHDDEHNHMCFVAGTRVSTARGAVPIEFVRVGDLAWTRSGWRPVAAAGPTGLREVVCVRFDGGELVGTSDHPVWVVGQGWRQLGEISARSGDALAVVVEVADRDIAAVAEQAAYDAGRVVVVDVEADAARIVPAPTRRRPSADSAAAALAFDEGRVLRGADPVLRAEPVGAIAGAPIGVAALPSSRAGSAFDRMALRSGVVSAQDRNPAVLTVARPVAAPIRHASVIDDEPDCVGEAVVYNLTVAGAPEFFANGALVHNCRAFAYLVVAKFPPPRRPGDAAHPWDEPERERDHLELRRGHRDPLRDVYAPPLPYDAKL